MVILEARPEPGTEAFAESGGAYVKAWIDAPTPKEATERAVEQIREAGWIVETPGEGPVSRPFRLR